MPKSKRAQAISLTKTDKKTRQDKEKIGDDIRECVENFKYVWVFRVDNMRNTFLKTIRQDWKGSRILFGRTRVMQKALGKSAEEECAQNIHTLTNYMNGDIGLLMTDEEPQVVTDYFETFVQTDFARAGLVSPITFVVPEGIVYSRGGQIAAEDDVPMVHSLESTVRQLGMPTQLKNGKVILGGDYTVCKEGDVLDGRQTRLLKQFGVACASFKVVPVAYYDKNAESVTVVNK